jgi:hypothetical protein
VAFQWPTLIRKITDGQCTPFLGAGASYPALPLGKSLAADLVRRYEAADPGNPRKCPLADQSDLAAVTQWVAIDSGDSGIPKVLLADLIKERSAPNFDDPCEPHRLLAELPLPLYITTNYDDFMFSALRRVQDQPAQRRVPILSVHQDYCRWTDKLMLENASLFDDRKFKLNPAHPVVFHLHGHIDRDPAARGAVEAMVATEDDYLDFLVNITGDLNNAGPLRASKPQMLPLAVRTALRGNTLLFVGYGLRDVNFRVILRAIRRSLDSSSEPLNIAVQYAGDDPREMQEYLESYFARILKLNVHWSAPRDFAAELRKKMA